MTHSIGEEFTLNKIQWLKITHDSNGNPRYVCHFLNLNTQAEKDDFTGLDFIARKYAKAVKRANKLGGKKYHTKGYGGGIVFQSHNLADTERAILELVAKEP